jgi:hypothetical protein
VRLAGWVMSWLGGLAQVPPPWWHELQVEDYPGVDVWGALTLSWAGKANAIHWQLSDTMCA